MRHWVTCATGNIYERFDDGSLVVTNFEAYGLAMAQPDIMVVHGDEDEVLEDPELVDPHHNAQVLVPNTPMIPESPPAEDWFDRPITRSMTAALVREANQQANALLY